MYQHVTFQVRKNLESLATVFALQFCLKVPDTVVLHVIDTEEALMADVTFMAAKIFMNVPYMSRKTGCTSENMIDNFKAQ